MELGAVSRQLLTERLRSAIDCGEVHEAGLPPGAGPRIDPARVVDLIIGELVMPNGTTTDLPDAGRRRMARFLANLPADHEAAMDRAVGAGEDWRYAIAALSRLLDEGHEREPAVQRLDQTVLVQALKDAAGWFADYAKGHLEKGHYAKAQRNLERAKACADAAGVEV